MAAITSVGSHRQMPGLATSWDSMGSVPARFTFVVGSTLSPSLENLKTFGPGDLYVKLQELSETVHTDDLSKGYHHIALFVRALEVCEGAPSIGQEWVLRNLRDDIAHGLNARFYGSILGVDDYEHSGDFVSDKTTLLSQTEAFSNCSVEFIGEFVNYVESALPVVISKDIIVMDELRSDLSTNQIRSFREFTNELLDLCPHVKEPTNNMQPLLLWASTQPGSFQSLCDWSVSKEGHTALMALRRDTSPAQTWPRLVCNFASMLALLNLQPWSRDNDDSPISGSFLKDFEDFLQGEDVPNAQVVLQKLLHALRRTLAARARDSQRVVAERLIAVIDRVYLSTHQPPQTYGYLDEYHRHRLGNMPDEPNKSHAEALQLVLLEPGIHEQEIKNLEKLPCRNLMQGLIPMENLCNTTTAC
ncbi:hypothetical protein LX36DRAFT_674403 [Colletotrichum falcatum]|nr:hypothetical protein LX36DRAFT_674403 [Colletotrichum falcatum]